ncbi:hypothetical protein N7488_003405 [Penicillium malachiteum]|nr:hypothetical protein N7488_003405 [Penicillium malachiteum]
MEGDGPADPRPNKTLMSDLPSDGATLSLPDDVMRSLSRSRGYAKEFWARANSRPAWTPDYQPSYPDGFNPDTNYPYTDLWPLYNSFKHSGRPGHRLRSPPCSRRSSSRYLPKLNGYVVRCGPGPPIAIDFAPAEGLVGRFVALLTSSLYKTKLTQAQVNNHREYLYSSCPDTLLAPSAVPPWLAKPRPVDLAARPALFERDFHNL